MKGIVIGEADKPVIDNFLTAMHEKNAKPEHVRASLDFYYKTLEDQQAKIAAKDQATLATVEDTLRPEWGAEYRANWNAVANLLSGMPNDKGEMFKHARLGDGTPLLNDPDIARWLAGIAKEQNPAATLVPNIGGNQMQGVEEELKKINTVMRTDRRAYDKDPAMQARYRELLDAKEKLAARTKAA
jgi:hypothetical protein